LNAKIGVLWIFWRFRAATQLYNVRKMSPRNKLVMQCRWRFWYLYINLA